MEDKEVQKYREFYAEKHKVSPEDIVIQSIIPVEGSDDEVEVDYINTKEKHVERIRRITGYLTGTLDRWNNAKRAEEHDRVKHA